MNLEKINSCLDFYFHWSNAKDNPESFAALDGQLEAKTKIFFSELCNNAKYKDWIRSKVNSGDEGNYLSILAEAIRVIISRSKSTLMKFSSEQEIDSYVYLTLFGREGKGGIAGRIRNENKGGAGSLEEKAKKYNNRRNKQVEAEEIVDDIDPDTTDKYNASDESSDYDTDGVEVAHKIPFIEAIETSYYTAEETENKAELSLLDINNTVAYLLEIIRHDLSADDIALEKKIAWQVGVNYKALLNEKVGLFTDPVLISNDSAVIVRYEHWQNWRR